MAKPKKKSAKPAKKSKLMKTSSLDTKGKFYLGRLYDLKKDQVSADPVLYDPADLTTHGVVFGMTGSGKTGLCINILEEAALQGIPALMIDPKGDITNTLLHFPNLKPADFVPWVNPDEARRSGKSVKETAQIMSGVWAKGLAEWGIGPERIQALADAAEFAVYTPGSDAGYPVSILASLKAPQEDWGRNKESIRERIASTATAILGLVGFDEVDPVKSREHILLANLFEQAWSQSRDLELGDLIRQVQNPPIAKLGVLDLDQFFPPRDRAALALRLNNILAAPSFQTWLEGTPLDIDQLLFTRSRKPRHSVFLLSHLSDAERMFFVTLLYSAVEAWMRNQPGTSALRALIYFDEIHGYLPPVAQPPSKGPMLRMLKQARAFGVGQLLATQNPVDVDYKALSNAGSWFIGKLQADRDKERLLDGLEGAAPGAFKRSDYDKQISALDKRVFLLHNVHEDKPIIFYTRWAMNYLAGPLTRNQIPALNELAGSPSLKMTAQTKKEATLNATSDSGTLGSRPVVPGGVQEVFLPASLSLEAAAAASKRDLPSDAKRVGLAYRPALLAQAQVRFLQRKYNLDIESHKAALVTDVPERGLRWEDFEHEAFDERKLEGRPEGDAAFGDLGGVLGNEQQLKLLERDFADWAYRTSEVQMWANDGLNVYGGPELSREEFLAKVEKEAQVQREAEVERAKSKYDAQLKTLQRRLEREKRELSSDETKAGQRKMEEIGTHLENVIGLFAGSRRRLTTSLTKRRMSAEADASVTESKETIAELEKEMQQLGEEIQDAMEDVHNRWDATAQAITQVPLAPARNDVYVSTFGVAWLPHHRVSIGGREVEIPAYE
jgi:hypothetical protein